MPLLGRTASLALAVGAALALPATPALASPLPADRDPGVIRVTGPTYVYDRTFRDVTTHIRVGERWGHTWVSLRATGFPRSAVGRTFGAHVHVNKCGPRPEDAGGHYRNPRVPGGAPLVAKEIWLDFTVGPDRVGRALALRAWTIPKGAAGSIVVHALPTDPETGDAGGRLMCTTVPFGAGHR